MNVRLGDHLALSAVSGMLAALSGCRGADMPAEAPAVEVRLPPDPARAAPADRPASAEEDVEAAVAGDPERSAAVEVQEPGRRPHNWDGREGLGSGNCCKGRNECKGKGMCKTERHDCKGMNECKGLGGCRPADCTEDDD
jgi:hypothetical protein